MASNRSVRRAQEPVTYTCTLCDSVDNVNWYCNDCRETLCDRCKEAHARGRKTNNDDVVSIRKANRQGDRPVPEVCKLHPGKLCDAYCCDCDMLMCLVCLSQTHKQHNWKQLEDEFNVKKQHLKEHMTAISAKIAHFKNETLNRHRIRKAVKDNIDTMRNELHSQRTKLKAEVDSIVDAVLAELSTLEKKESAMCNEDYQRFWKNMGELTRLLEKAETTDTSSGSIFEMERSLRSTLPLYDVNTKCVLPKQPNFVSGSIDRVILTRMVGKVHHVNQREKIEIHSKHVQRLSMFTVTQQKQINGICPVDDSHAWLSILQYEGLVLVNREGLVTETVKLNFCPYRIAMVGTTDILMSSNPVGTLVYKLSLYNKLVTTFSDISPHRAWDISINESGEVFVSTNKPDIVVLNQSGTIVRTFTCVSQGVHIVCLSSGIAVSLGQSRIAREIIITDVSGTVIQTWTGELDNGQKPGRMHLCKMSCGKYDRLFVPDFNNNQVYVLRSDGKLAKCLLDKTHGVVKPTTVGVDTCGNVWIGCNNGTVHVMRL